MSWLARTATGKSDGISPAVIPSRKRPSTSATAPAAAFCRNFRTSASSTSGAMHKRRHPRADPFSVAVFTTYLRKAASELRRVLRRQQRLRGESAFLLRIILEDAQEYRPLVPEDGIQARPSHAQGKPEGPQRCGAEMRCIPGVSASPRVASNDNDPSGRNDLNRCHHKGLGNGSHRLSSNGKKALVGVKPTASLVVLHPVIQSERADLNRRSPGPPPTGGYPARCQASLRSAASSSCGSRTRLPGLKGRHP